MRFLRRLFGGTLLSWPRVLLVAVVAAVVTVVGNTVPWFDNTSWQDMAVYPEVWLLLALFVVLNCQTRREAMAKCFVFFLVSQPLIYLLEVPFSTEGFGLFRYYGYWFCATLLTVPAAFLAFEIKKGSMLSALLVSAGSGYLVYAAVFQADRAAGEFPRHLLSAVFCLVWAFLLIFVLLHNKKTRMRALSVTVSVLIVSGVLTLGREDRRFVLASPADACTVTVSDETVVRLAEKNDQWILYPRKTGTATVICRSDDGVETVYEVSVTGGNHIFVSEGSMA